MGTKNAQHMHMLKHRVLHDITNSCKHTHHIDNQHNVQSTHILGCGNYSASHGLTDSACGHAGVEGRPQ
jgi:hypothetical protein